MKRSFRPKIHLRKIHLRPSRVQRRAALFIGLCLLPVVALLQPDAAAADTDGDAPPPASGFVPPRLLGEVTAVYPPEAFANNIEATVGLTLYIDEAGNVVKTEAAEPAGDARFDFDRNAEAAFASARFTPATQDGVPIAVKLRVDYAYKIDFRDPVVEEEVQADYPEVALRLGITDSVLAELDVSAAGAVTAVRITRPSAHPEYGFEAAALPALKRLRFSPAAKNGVPVPVTVVYRYDFVLPKRWVPPEEQPVNLTIKLLERGTRIPVSSGVISLRRGEDPPIEETFADGIYKGKGLPPGRYEVLVAADGYAPVRTLERVAAGKAVEATYLIERESYDVLDQADPSGGGGDYVYETRESKIEKEVSVTTLPVSEIQRVPGNSGDAVKVVQNLPGVSRSTFNTGAVIIRGSAPSDSAVLLDGTPIPMIYHFGGLASTINSDSLGAVDFLPGNFSVKYGRALGGVIDAHTRPPNAKQYKGYLDLDTTDGSLVLEGPIVKNLSFFASVRRSWFDSVLKAVLDDDDLAMTTAPRYWDYQARLHWSVPRKRAPAHELELMVYGSDDVMEMLDDSGAFKIKTAFHHAKLTFGLEAGSLENRLAYDFGWNRYLFRRGGEKDDKVVFSHAVRDDLRVRVGDGADLLAGIDVHIQQYRVDVNGSNRGAEDLLNGEMPAGSGYFGGRDPGDIGESEADLVSQREEDNRFLPALYLAFVVHPTERLELTIGGRLDHDSLSNERSFDARSTGRFSVLKYLDLKGGVGTFHKPPDERSLSKQFGNPNLGLESAIHASFGTEARLPVYEALSLDLTGFYKLLNDLVVPSDRRVERDGEVVLENLTNDGEGRVWGVEVMLRHRPLHNFFGWISYTFSRSERKDGPGEPRHLFKYDQTHILTLLGSCKLPKGFQVGLRFRYVSGTPYTPLTSGVFDSDAENYEPVARAPYSARTEAYHQLDIRVDKDWIFKYWILTVYLEVQNMYFHANEELSHYSYDYAEREPIRGLPIQPGFGIRGAF